MHTLWRRQTDLEMITLSRCALRQSRSRRSKVAALLVTSILLLYMLLETFAPTITFSKARWPTADRRDLPRFILSDSNPPAAATHCAECRENVLLPDLASAHQSVYSRTGISCAALFQGDRHEQRKAKQYMNHNAPEFLTPEQLVRMTKDCKNFRRMRGYASEPMSKDEAEFPIAFSVLIKGDVNQAERLLRAIYAPQNYYCLHIDLKSNPLILAAMRGVASCFDNVFVARRLESVYWGHVSIMYAEMNCLEDLLRFSWKYFINLSGQMFPAHSNRELVQILRLYDGANDVEGTDRSSEIFEFRLRTKFVWRLFEPMGKMFPTFVLHSSPPFHVKIYKGSHQVALTRAFVVFFLFSQKSRDLVEWFADTMIPDEHIWATLNHNLHLNAPGSYKGHPESKPFTTRVSIWSEDASQVNWSKQKWECHGKWARKVCIFGVGDLEWLYHRPELFLNKFHADFEWLAYDCMEELIHNQTMAALQGNVTFDPTYYLRLPFVANKTLVTSVEEALKYWT